MTINLNSLEGFKARAVSAGHLPELKEDLQKLMRQGLLDKQIGEICLKFNYEVSEVLPGALSFFRIYRRLSRRCRSCGPC